MGIRIYRGAWLRLLALLLIGGCGVSAQVIHVSPAGRDSASGSVSAPLATLAEALKRAGKVNGQREIRLSAGTHVVVDTVEVTRQNSGVGGRPLKIVGDPEGGSVLSGMRPLRPRGWSRLSDSAYQARVSDVQLRRRMMQYTFSSTERAKLGRLSRRGFDADDNREVAPVMLHIGPQRMMIARWPDIGTVTASEVIESGPQRYGVDDSGWEKFWNSGGSIAMESDRAARWQTPEDVWINGRFGKAWEWSFNRLKTVRKEGHEIELAFGEVSGIGSDPEHAPEFYFENVFEELDQAGEYYIDPLRGLMFFLPPEGMRNWASEARLSWVTEEIVRLDGAQHVVLENFRVECGRSHGLVVKDGLDIVCKNLQIVGCAGDGIRADGRDIRISGLVAEDLGGRGVLLCGGDPVSLRASGNTVTNSRFVGLSWWDRAWRPALELKGVGHQIRDCDFSDLPHMAIEASGNDFRISGCWFSRTCRDFRDMCAIYFNLGEQPQMRGTVISNNLFQDIGIGSNGARGGVYFDNGTMGVTVTDNIFHRVGEHEDGWAVMNHGGAYNRVDDNVFIDCPMPYHVAYWWNTWAKDQLPDVRQQWQKILKSPETARHHKAYAELAEFFDEDRVLPDSNSFSGNVISNPKRGLLAPVGMTAFGGPLERVKAAGNRVGEPLSGLSFDAAGRPLVPGWKPWRALALR